MSDTSSPPSLPTVSSSPSPTSNGGNDDDNNNNNNNNNNNFPGGASSSLYLFTFLATLLLLLAVSCAIVMRSFVLRRRFRRRVEEALAAGIILPQQPPRKRDFGEKPQLWDAWLVPSDARWYNMMPVAASILSESYTGAGIPKKSGKNATDESNPTAISRTRSAISNVFRYARPRQSTRTAPTPKRSNSNSGDTTPSAFPAPGEAQVEDAKLQVSVLIAMPSPYRPHGSEITAKGKERSCDADGEEEVPDVMFGVADLPWKVRSPNAS